MSTRGDDPPQSMTPEWSTHSPLFCCHPSLLLKNLIKSLAEDVQGLIHLGCADCERRQEAHTLACAGSHEQHVTLGTRLGHGLCNEGGGGSEWVATYPAIV